MLRGIVTITPNILIKFLFIIRDPRALLLDLSERLIDIMIFQKVIS